MVGFIYVIAFIVLLVVITVYDACRSNITFAIGFPIIALLLLWAIISSNCDYTRKVTKQLPVHIVENHAIIIDGNRPINVNNIKQFEKGDIVYKETLGGEWLFGIYWDEVSTYKCCVGDPYED